MDETIEVQKGLDWLKTSSENQYQTSNYCAKVAVVNHLRGFSGAKPTQPSTSTHLAPSEPLDSSHAVGLYTPEDHEQSRRIGNLDGPAQDEIYRYRCATIMPYMISHPPHVFGGRVQQQQVVREKSSSILIFSYRPLLCPTRTPSPVMYRPFLSLSYTGYTDISK